VNGSIFSTPSSKPITTFFYVAIHEDGPYSRLQIRCTVCTNEDEIEKRIQQYKQNEIQPAAAGGNKKYYEYNVSLYHQVSLDSNECPLTFINLSIEAYNQQDFPKAIDHLTKLCPLSLASYYRIFSDPVIVRSRK
jgi:hypothetical protein